MPFGKPKTEIPDLPADITIVSDEYLMGLFTQFVSWQNYAETQLAEAEVEERKAEAQLENLKQRGMALNWNARNDTKVTVAKAEALTSPEYEKTNDRFLVAYARRKMTLSIYNNCERSAALVSRELSRRIGGTPSPMERRQMRWNP